MQSTTIKKEEEGQFDEEQLIWGIYMDFGTQEVRLPEQKCIKAQFLLALPELQPGCREVRLKTAQESRGSARFRSTVQLAITPEIGALDHMLVQEQGGSAWVCPKGNQEEVEQAWDEWDQTLELFRVMFEIPEAWSSTFQASFPSLLSPRERMSLPGQEARTRWTGGDATKESTGAVDWCKNGEKSLTT